MTDMQIAIGLGRKASDNASLIFVNVQVLGDDAANEIPRHFIFSIIGRGAFTTAKGVLALLSGILYCPNATALAEELSRLLLLSWKSAIRADSFLVTLW